MNACDAAFAADWAIDQDERLQGILQIAAREHEETPEALEAYRAARLTDAERAGVRDGVAILYVDGPLFAKANLFTAYSGATSYDMLRRDCAAVLDDPGVGAILIKIDSPGGEVTGASELARAIFDARGRKPIVAYVGGMGCSAAFWLACAADEIVCADTAVLGSVGVRAAFADTRERDARSGVKTYEFVSSQSPSKASDPATDKGRADIQRRVDAMAEVFVGAVAEYRGIDREKVLSWDGGVEVGAAAVAAGMADRLGSFEGALAELASRTKSADPFGAPAGHLSTTSGTIMAEQQTQTPPVATAPAITVETVAAAPAIADHFRAMGAAAERERIGKIRKLGALGASAADIDKAIAEGTAPEAFALAVADAGAARQAAALAGIQGDEAAVKPPSDSGTTAADGDPADVLAAQISAFLPK